MCKTSCKIPWYFYSGKPITPALPEYVWLAFDVLGELDLSHSKGNKFVVGVKINTTVDLKMTALPRIWGTFFWIACISSFCVVQQGAGDRETKQWKTISYRDSAAIAFILDFLRRTPSLRVIRINHYKIPSLYLRTSYTGSDFIYLNKWNIALWKSCS